MKKEKIKNFIQEHWIEVFLGSLVLILGAISALLNNQKKVLEGENKCLKDINRGQEKAIKNLSYHLGKNHTRGEIL